VSPRVISSAQTFFAKFIVPIIVLAVLPYLAFRSGVGPIFVPVGALAALSVYWYYSRLKKVALDADGLVISNYFREVRVPWRQIVDVSGSRWANTRQIKVTFDRDIGFGASIIFMPKIRLLFPGQESPVAQELRDLMLENQGR
jgi:hypothetical protein